MSTEMKSLYSRKLRVYITPNPFEKNQIYNPYVLNLYDSFKNDNRIKMLCNLGFRKFGFLNFVFYIFCDVIILSWPENLAFARFRILYIPYFIVCVCLMKILDEKIVWIVHNKHPHAGKNYLSTFLMKFMAKISTICITHSQEGVRFFNSELINKPKCYYIPHPVYSSQIKESLSLQWDYIIWGEIQKRKGIVDFLEYIKTDTFFCDKKILICGKCEDSSYNGEICKRLSSNITYINAFLDDKELDNFIKSSRCILFTYNSSSVLCSGALIYSLNFCKPIIAPNSGVFSEMTGIVSCFNSFEEIKKIKMIDNTYYIKQYIDNNSWQSFPQKVMKLLDNGEA